MYWVSWLLKLCIRIYYSLVGCIPFFQFLFKSICPSQITCWKFLYKLKPKKFFAVDSARISFVYIFLYNYRTPNFHRSRWRYRKKMVRSGNWICRIQNWQQRRCQVYIFFCRESIFFILNVMSPFFFHCNPCRLSTLVKPPNSHFNVQPFLNYDNSALSWTSTGTVKLFLN